MNLIEDSWEFEAACAQIRSLLPPIGSCQIHQMTDAIMRDFVAMTRLAEHGMVLKPHELTREGTLMLDLLDKLFFTLGNNPASDQPIKRLALSTGVWIVQHGGSLQEMGLLVNAVATFANQSSRQQDLEALYEASVYLLVGADEFIKADLDKRDTMRPWRLLNLNHGIIATRTNNIEVMKRAYGFLIQHLPEEAPHFFKMAKQKVQSQQHPQHVRNLVTQYQHLFSASTPSPDGEALTLH